MNIYVGGPKTVIVSDMQGPCPDGFHVPLSSEWVALRDAGVTIGAWGSDGQSYSAQEMAAKLHLPHRIGYRYYDTSVKEVGTSRTNGNYRSADFYDDRSLYIFIIQERYNYIRTSYMSSNYGCFIRPFKDEPAIPDSSWTKTYSGTGDAGIYYNSELGLLSISSDGTNWITIADKNLGATEVWNYSSTATEYNTGYTFQGGNNYGFPGTLSSGSITTSSSQVDVTGYGPGNYYESSTWINLLSVSWFSTSGTNLRGGVSQGSSTKTEYQEVQNIYIGEVLKPDKGPLRFIANTAGSTIKLRKYGSPTSVTLETSTDGNNWTPYIIGDVITLNNVGDTIYWRNTSETDTGFSTSLSNYYQFEMTGSLKAEGIVNYLLNKNSTTTLSNWCFIYLFSGCPITTAPALPSITLAHYCYQYMFYYCSSLVTAPSLPATTLGTQSYYAMFSNCENLETLPALPSTTISDYCYYQMFYRCYKIALSETKTGAYQTEYRIPTSGTGTYGTQAFYQMFDNTGGTYRTDPTINKTYYTSNTVV